MPLFTVNIATYNQLPSLKVILAALEFQTVKDFEVIVTDDGSSDGTKEWAKGQNFKYFWQEDEGFRIAKSKNMGIKAAEGEYFVSLEADVIPHFRLLEEYKAHMRPNRVALGVRHDIEELPESIDFKTLDKNILSMDWRMDNLRRIRNIERPWRLCSGCNVAFPTQLLRDIGGWNEAFKHYGIDDYEVCLRMLMAGCDIIALPAAYGYHVRHALRETVPDNLYILERLESQHEDSNRVR